MTHLQDYVLWRGDLPLSSSPLQDLDSLVMAMIVYLDVPEKPVSIREFAALRSPEKQKSRFRVECCELLRQIAQTVRYRDVQLHHGVSILNQTTQFAALTAQWPDGTTVVAFRGTDGTLTGWHEDFAMSFESPVPAQTEAQKYLEQCCAGRTSPVVVTGHSKGGNLAVYAAAHVSPAAQTDIQRVISFDGPGVDDDTAASPGYAAVSDRIMAYVPRFAVVGLLLAAHPVHRVVLSDNVGIMQHDPFSWQVQGKDFCYAEEVNRASVLVNETVHKWLAQCSREQRRIFVDGLFKLLSSAQEVDWRQSLVSVGAIGNAMLHIFGQIDWKTVPVMASVLKNLAVISVENVTETVRQRENLLLPEQKETDTQGGTAHE